MQPINFNNTEMNNLLRSGKIYHSVPVHLYKFLNDKSYRFCPKSLKSLQNYLKENCCYDSSEWEDAFIQETFTYWDLKKKKPMFDIWVYKDSFSQIFKYGLSNNSLFGMIWLVGNKLSVGMENVIDVFGLDVPLNTDMVKYTRNNYNIAKISAYYKK